VKWEEKVRAGELVREIYCDTASVIDKKKLIKALIEVSTAFPIAIIISLGMSYHNTRDILQGISGKKTAFIRTPKFSESSLNNHYKRKQRFNKYLPELLIFFYCLFASLSDLYFKDFGFLIYHVLMLSGFGIVLWSAYSESSVD